MERCQLTDKQKHLIRTLVPGLENGKVEAEWILISGDDGLSFIMGLDPFLWDESWHEVKRSDFLDFANCGFVTATRSDNFGGTHYTLHVQKILDAVAGNFGENPPRLKSSDATRNARSVFVIHGRNESIRRDFFQFLRALGLAPLEWDECIRRTGKASPYIGDILDTAFSNAQAVIVLMTPDDIAQLVPKLQNPKDAIHEKELTGQARPNVLFEAGMAMGRDANRTILVEIGDLRPFSDIAGRMKINFDGTAKSRSQLSDRLKIAGCKVADEYAGQDWLDVGDFSPHHVEIKASDLQSNKWGKSGNIWWLHGDFIALLNALHSGNKSRIDNYLARCIHHAKELELTGIVINLQSIIIVTKDLSDEEWTSKLRQMYLDNVTSLLNTAGQIIQSKQVGFKPDPE